MEPAAFYSNWLDVRIMSSSSALKVVREMRTIFSARRIPGVVVSENGPGFASYEFRRIVARYGVRQTKRPWHLMVTVQKTRPTVHLYARNADSRSMIAHQRGRGLRKCCVCGELFSYGFTLAVIEYVLGELSTLCCST